MDQHADVIVVGAGPVGLVAALLLARQGHEVLLIDKWSAPYPLPRAIGLSHEAMRILHWAGVTRNLESALEFDERYAAGVMMSHSGEELMRVPFRARAESGWPEMSGFNQPDVEALMTEVIASHPKVKLLRGHVVTQVRQDDEAAEITVAAADALGAPVAGGAVRHLRAAYLVGADGAGSIVRQSLQLPFTDMGFAYDWLVVDIKPTVERDWKIFLGQALGPGRPTTWAPAGPGRRRFEFMMLPGEKREAMNTPETAWRLLAECGVNPGNAHLVRHAVYTFRACWAERWRVGRAVLAGDAAHLTPPFLGQGLNLGVRDAANLAWHLDLVLRGVVPPDTLDDYGSERLAFTQVVIGQAVELGRMICVTEPAACEQRDGMLGAVRANPQLMPPPPPWRLGAGALLADDPQGGLLGLQGLVERDGRQGNFDDICGAGRFVLISRQGDPATALGAAAREVWQRLGGITAHVSVDPGTPGSGALRDLERRYDEWFDQTGSEIVLMRPDFYVFGTGKALADADALVTRLAAGLRMTLPSTH